ncbi:MAG: ATP synthase F1 subunit gamma [Deltaproteobacteria bacterium]|nr:ATP synthase F1 subunit gamma [Candidatus Anaeroferrophillus wilburensis]MBN2889090.1 ATP synthase F1 subunit gamma [Deltaproteobacteria bacterium]
MANLRDIRKRISSVKSTQQITKAMQMVAASKLKRAQDGVVAARPYATKMSEVLASLALRTEAGKHPLLQRREEKNVELIVMTSDRGLCGGYNNNVIKASDQFLREKQGDYEKVILSVVGKKVRDYYRRRNWEFSSEFLNPGNVTFSYAEEIANEVIDRYVEKTTDAVYVVYTEFKSAMSQNVIVQRLLPVEPQALGEDEVAVEYIYEPSEDELLADILPRYVYTQLFRMLLESIASEHGSRMTAMDSATNNAVEMVAKLTLLYNRARQAAITTELMEIVSGAEALG